MFSIENALHTMLLQKWFLCDFMGPSNPRDFDTLRQNEKNEENYIFFRMHLAYHGVKIPLLCDLLEPRISKCGVFFFVFFQLLSVFIRVY